jgi:predicted dehydrogenase
MNIESAPVSGDRLPAAVVIGYGSIGRRHARALAAIGCRLAIINRGEKARTQAHLDHPAAVVAERCEALDRQNFPWSSCVAVIASWGPSHASFFHLLADRGVKTILCEKPMASSVCAAHAMAERAMADDIALGLNHTLRYALLADAMLGCARQYDLGEPWAMMMTGGASCLVTNGVHWIDFASQLFGAQPSCVSSTASGDPINPRSADLMMYGGTAVWLFPSGREAVISLNNGSSVFPDVQILYRDATVQLGYIVGEADEYISATVLRRNRDAIRQFPAITRTGKPTEALSSGRLFAARGFNDGLRAAALELISGNMHSAPAEVGVQSVSSCIGALVSGRDRRTVDLPIDPRASWGQEMWALS